MKLKITFFLALTLIVVTTSGVLAARPGDFDNYIFSLSWQPAFCESHPDKKECSSRKEEDFHKTNLVLHGLWPNKKGDKKHRYGYCGVPSPIRKQDKAAAWCRMPDLHLSPATKNILHKIMPGYQSCLQNHEWYKHGTCSEMTSDEYFTVAARLVTAVAATNLGNLLRANTGKMVTFVSLTAAACKDYGDKAVNLRFICRDGMLSEIRMYLKKELPPEGGVTADMLVRPEDGQRNSCSGNILIDQFDGSGSQR